MTQCTAMTSKHIEGGTIVGEGRLCFHNVLGGGGGVVEIIGGGRLVKRGDYVLEVLRYIHCTRLGGEVTDACRSWRFSCAGWAWRG